MMVSPPISTDAAAVDCRVGVSEDRLRAWVGPPTGFVVADVTVGLIQDRVREAGLVLAEAVRDGLLARAGACGRVTLDGPVCIAQGEAALDAVPGRIEPIEPDAPPDDAGCDDYYRSRIRTVRAGQPVARVIRPVPGRDGRDVFGAVIPHAPAPPLRVELGANVALEESSGQVTATCHGSLNIDGDRVWVDDLLHVTGNIDFTTGNVEFGGDVVIDGGVGDLFAVRGRNVTVHKVIEGAHVSAVKQLHADGGIVGKEKARCLAGEALAARFIAAAEVGCGGPIAVLTEISNSKVACRGKLTLAKGTILHSKISARGGVAARSIGSAAELRTVVEVGATEEQVRPLARRWAELHDRRTQEQHMRAQLEGALAKGDRLSVQQREKAAKLLAHLSKQEEDVRRQVAVLAAEWRDLLAGTRAEIEVQDRVWPGVVLRLAGVEVEVREPIRGPVRFVVRDDGWTRKVVAVLLSRHGELDLGGVETETRGALRRLAALAA